MKNKLSILVITSVFPVLAMAQNMGAEIDQELEAISDAQAYSSGARSGNVTAQPVYIYQGGAPQQAQNVQRQPPTVIESSPLSESNADRLRKARQDVEVQTEQRIVEKLEKSRIDDEKRRANVLFGDNFNQIDNGVSQQSAPAQALPVQVIQTVEPVQQEIVSANKYADLAEETPLVEKYMSAVLGIGDYPDVRNVQGNYALGVNFGTKTDGIIIEGGFLYSNYTALPGGNGFNNFNTFNSFAFIPQTVDVNQYSGSIASKVQFFDGIVKPVVGGLAQYSYRTYNWSNNNFATNFNNSANSHAIDFGAIAGVDFELSKKYSFGADFRYMWNLSSRLNNAQNTWLTSPAVGTPIERLNYYVLSFAARVNF